MTTPDAFSFFTDRAYYSAHFMDVGFWEPFARQVCCSHGFSSSKITQGLPGTYPTFLVELDEEGIIQPARHVVVKFFGPLFNGAEAFRIEKALENWLRIQPLLIPSPRILAAGELNADWQYLIFEYIPGVSIGQLRDKLTRKDWLSVAGQLGVYVRQLHSLALPNSTAIPAAIRPTWDGYASFLGQQKQSCLSNHQAWQDIPGHLLGQLEDFVLPVEQLFDFSAPPHLIHADLTADHLLGRIDAGTWQTLAVIDWGDAMVGNLLYELVALHLDLFNCDKLLLRHFLDAYELPAFYRLDFAWKAFSTVLLHQFPMPARIYASHQDASTLEELAERIFAL